VPGIPALLELLVRREFSLAVVSSSRLAIVTQVLRGASLDGYFECLVSADDNIRPKPAPDAYLLALQRLGVRSIAAIAIEDSAVGVTASRAAEQQVGSPSSSSK